ncbi:hypothetical protein TSAR_002057, partial [Trichomalopsis sarcophagae]
MSLNSPIDAPRVCYCCYRRVSRMYVLYLIRRCERRDECPDCVLPPQKLYLHMYRPLR